MTPLTKLWRVSDEAINELKTSRIKPSNIYAVFISAWIFPLLFFLVYFLAGVIIQESWAAFWYDLILRGTSAEIWYMLVSLSFDVMILILVAFLPMLAVLLRNECRRSAKDIGIFFVVFTLPAEILWHLLALLLAPSPYVSGGFSALNSLWIYTTSMSLLAQWIGLLTMTYGLLNGLKESGKVSNHGLK